MYKGKKISVVIPAYNEESFIAAAINDVADFTDKIYVVDDGSTDKTNQIVSEIAGEYGKIPGFHRGSEIQSPNMMPVHRQPPSGLDCDQFHHC